ncbi:MAG: exosortase H [Lysobacterales bacterium]
MTRFIVVFLVLLGGLFTLEVLQPVEQWVIDPFTAGIARICVWLVSIFDNDAVSFGKVIQSTRNGFAVSIERGCNGIEALIILFAALFAFPSTLRQKLIGFGLGFVAIQALNLVRIISLFYIGQWSHTWFEWFHLYLWQALIIIDALVVWLIWLRWIARADRAGRARASPQGRMATAS